MMRAFLTCAAAALTIGASALAAGAQTPTEINFGVIPTEASINQKKNWEPFLQAMSKATGFKVNGVYATDYAGVIEGMRFNKVQIAWYGNKSGMEAVDRAGGEVPATETTAITPTSSCTKTAPSRRSRTSSSATSPSTSASAIQTRRPAF